MIIKTLAVETSCDDTSISVTIYNDEIKTFAVEEMVSYTQTIHNSYGWVVPEIASREHATQVLLVFKELLSKYDIDWKKTQEKDFFENIDFISYTEKPWLPWALVVWKVFAQTLWMIYKKKVVPIHHIHGHIFSLLLDRKLDEVQFPAVIITVSWWHNSLYLVNEDLTFKELWRTLDDAGGECFDKVARMLWGPYPWGFWIWQQANSWGKSDISFSRIFLDKNVYDFSFSGMKSQVHKSLEDLKAQKKELTKQVVCDIAWEFQEAVVEVLSKKLIRAWLIHKSKTLWMVGGVSCNDRWFEYTEELLKNQKRLSNQASKLVKDGTVEAWHFDEYLSDKDGIKEFNYNPKLYRPIKKVYSTDNAGMIWVVGIMNEIWVYK